MLLHHLYLVKPDLHNNNKSNSNNNIIIINVIPNLSLCHLFRYIWHSSHNVCGLKASLTVLWKTQKDCSPGILKQCAENTWVSLNSNIVFLMFFLHSLYRFTPLNVVIIYSPCERAWLMLILIFTYHCAGCLNTSDIVHTKCVLKESLTVFWLEKFVFWHDGQ